jgi:hypothetical protein
MYVRILILCSLLLTIPSCTLRNTYYDKRKLYLRKVFIAGPVPDGTATIFIHGTKESIISKLVHKLDYPYGVVQASTVQANSVLARIGQTLSKVCPEQFALDTFYFYGWHGRLTFPSRTHAAERLYNVIKNHKGHLTIMAHSHGCNVALYLAALAEKEQNSSFKVDRLILLAAPVQIITKHLVHSPIFKEVYTFYSTADFMQIGDPQGLYWESYAYSTADTKIPFLSSRTFDPAPHIKQTRVLLDRHSPGHLGMMLSRFIQHIPSLLRMISDRSENGGYESCRNFYTINIPPCGFPPAFISNSELKGAYIPRSSYYKARQALQKGQPY